MSSELESLRPLGVSVRIDPVAEAHHSSFAIAGLRALRERRLIDGLEVAWARPVHRGEVELAADGSRTPIGGQMRKTTFLTVDDGRSAHSVAFDFRDSSQIFATDALRPGTVVWKRSFRPDIAAAAADRFGVAVQPAGLSFRVGCSSADRRAVLASMLACGARDASRLDRGTPRRLRSVAREAAVAWRAWPAQWDVARLREVHDEPTDAVVLFQTRLFDNAGDEDAHATNEQRAALVRALRAELGPRFRGGLTPDPLALARHPDCISDVAADRPSYAAALRRAAVVVSSRGLQHSIPWKVSESMAFGKCILSEAVDQPVPGPFDGTFAPFRTIEGCVAAAQALLADDDRRAVLAHAARRYYLEWVDPPVALHRMLAAVVEAGTN